MKKFLTAFASLAAAFAADAAPNVVNAPTGSFFKDSSNIAVAQLLLWVKIFLSQTTKAMSTISYLKEQKIPAC